LNPWEQPSPPLSPLSSKSARQHYSPASPFRRKSTVPSLESPSLAEKKEAEEEEKKSSIVPPTPLEMTTEIVRSPSPLTEGESRKRTPPREEEQSQRPTTTPSAPRQNEPREKTPPDVEELRSKTPPRAEDQSVVPLPSLEDAEKSTSPAENQPSELPTTTIVVDGAAESQSVETREG
jgi:hypothetical protein